MIFSEETDLKKPEINVNDEDVKKKIHISNRCRVFCSSQLSLFCLFSFDLTMNFMKTKKFPKSIKERRSCNRFGSSK